MHDKLTAVISESGIWNGNRKNTHAFLLSPSVFEMTEDQYRELTLLGQGLHDCLKGLSHIATIAYDRELNCGGTWVVARKVFSTGVPKVYQPLQGMNMRHLPKLLKVDLLVDQNGLFKIAEIDGHNKHGLGYSTLGLRFREALYPNAKALPGTVKVLSAEIKQSGHEAIKLFYADQELFYVPEFEIARQEFGKYGIDCQLASESAVKPEFLESGLFLDLPFLYKRKELYEPIIGAYKRRDVSFIIPPKPFLGAKGLLALLRNDAGNEYLEAMLRCFIKSESLERVRCYIPETHFVGRKAEGFDDVKKKVGAKRYVLKESISSGMKGTIFSDDGEFEVVLKAASRSYTNWILQEEVANKPQTFSWYEGQNGEATLRTSSDWFVRVTAQYVRRDLADVIITARRDKSVHGAKDCLQLGTIVL